jgi:AcrR family transcriptional regulator
MKGKNIDSIKVKEIAESLNISRSTFYLYHDSVYDVLQEIEDAFFKEFERVSATFQTLPLDDRYYNEPNPCIVKGLEFIYEQRELAVVLWGPYGDPAFQASCKKLIRKNFYAKALHEHYISGESELTAAFLVGGHQELINHWLMHDAGFTVEGITIILYRMMFGFRTKAVDHFDIPAGEQSKGHSRAGGKIDKSSRLLGNKKTPV